MIFAQRPWVGDKWDPWNRGPWDYALWQIKWENVLLRQLCNLRERLEEIDRLSAKPKYI